jgi:hypothetical protein
MRTCARCAIVYRFSKLLFLCLIIFLLRFEPMAVAQSVDMNLDTGIKPYETYDRAQENINVAGGNLNIQIPLVHLPGRNGHDLDVSLTYNSQIWTPVATLYDPPPPGGVSGNPTCSGSVPPGNYDQIYIGWTPAQQNMRGAVAVDNTGWQINLPTLYATSVQTFSLVGNCGYPSSVAVDYVNYVTNFALVMGDGSKYIFPNATIYSEQSIGCGYEPLGCLGWYQQNDHLLDYDYGSDQENGSPTQGQGRGQDILLDLSHANEASPYAVVRFRDGSQIQFSLAGWGGNGASNSPVNGPPTTGELSSTASALVDTNGNVISINTVGNSIVWQDTNLRKVTYTLASGNTPSTIQYLNSNGATQTITLAQSLVPPKAPTPSFTCPVVGGADTAPCYRSDGIMAVNSGKILSVLDSIQLPNGLSYRFQYNEYGEIIKVLYPAGGYTRYTYQAYPGANGYEWTTGTSGNADSRGVVEKDVCTAVATGAAEPSGYRGSTASNTCTVQEETTTYKRPAISPERSAVVTDPLGNQTDYQFNDAIAGYSPYSATPALLNAGPGSEPLETRRNIYQGDSTLLRTIITEHIANGSPSSQTTILPNGMQSQVQLDYDYSIHPYPVTLDDRNTSVTINNFGAEADNLIEKREYGFGSGATGSLIRKTDYQYLSPQVYLRNL